MPIVSSTACTVGRRGAEEEEEEEDDMAPSNSLPINGNEKTMNLNSLLLTNIQSSPYFKVKLYELKTYHEVIDEIYYKVGRGNVARTRRRAAAAQSGRGKVTFVIASLFSYGNVNYLP